MRLSALAAAAASCVTRVTGDAEIAQLSMDSRQSTKDGLFFCISGMRFDAHDFAQQALDNGAVALVTERELTNVCAPQVIVSDTRAAVSLMAAAFYGYPARQMRMMGVTGTKGKTTTSYLVKAIMERAGLKVGLIGTTGNMIGDRRIKSDLTTPDAIDLQRTLRQMADEGVQAVSMEVSAHALAMHRLEGVHYEVGCYTNLSQDHLDYFGTMDKYFECKQSFFTPQWVSAAAVNVDDEHGERLLRDIGVPHSTYGICGSADIFARDIDITENGVRFTLCILGYDTLRVNMRMTGMFNVYNALAAAAMCLVMGVEPGVIKEGLESVQSVPGRAEVLDTHTPYKVILDYSHSPDALENILTAVRDFARGHVIAVFGCGGDRDHGKRPMMGEIGGKLADYCILTSDNPRTEDPYDILASVEDGIKPLGKPYEVIENRRAAIKHAMTMAGEGDIIVLAGKGHETYQEIMGVKRPFDEKVIVQELLGEISKGV